MKPCTTILHSTDPYSSWRNVSASLSSDKPSDTFTLQAFLSAQSTRDVLVQSVRHDPGQTSDQDYDKRVAAIPTSTKYDTEQLKQDTQLLAKRAKIDKLTALRIVILTWQDRTPRQLQSQWADQELLCVQKVTSGGNAQLLANLKDQEQQETGLIDAHSQNTSTRLRHRQQLRAYLDEEALLLQVIQSLLAATSSHCTSQHDPNDNSPWIAVQSQQLWSALESPETVLLSCTRQISSRLDMLDDDSKWPSDLVKDDLLLAFQRYTCNAIISLLRLSLLSLERSSSAPREKDVMSWFELMDISSFITNINIIDPALSDDLTVISALTTALSIAVLDLPRVFDHLSADTFDSSNTISAPADFYMHSPQCLSTITNVLLGAASASLICAGPAVLTWSLISQKLRQVAMAADDQEQSTLDDGRRNSDPRLSRSNSLRSSISRITRQGQLLANITDIVPGEDPIALMGNAAVNDMQAVDQISHVTAIITNAFSNALDMHTSIFCRIVMMNLNRELLPIVNYGPDILQAIISSLSYDSAASTSAIKDSSWPSEPAQRLLDDDQAMGPRLIDQILRRYPYELTPFVATLTVLSKSLASIDSGESRTMLLLEDMSTFTTVMPANFHAYELSQEDEITNCIRLTKPIDIFTSSTRDAFRHVDGPTSNMLSLPQGCTGIILNDRRPFVVCWQYKHSALEYMGILLSTRLGNTRQLVGDHAQIVDRETATDVLALINAILQSLISAGEYKTATHMLGRLSYGLARNDDIVRVVLDGFEQELQTHVQQGLNHAQVSLAYLEASARFMTNILHLCPERVWSFLGRSRLLAANDNACTLTAIVNVSEMPSATYPFLRSCVSLFSQLITSVPAQHVAKHTSGKALARFEQDHPAATSASHRNMAAVILAFHRVLLDLHKAMVSWRFNDYGEKIIIETDMLSAFDSVLYMAYGASDSQTSSTSPCKTFKDVADVAIISFLATDDLAFQSLADIYLSAASTTEEGGPDSVSHAASRLCSIAIGFCTTLLNTCQATQLDSSALRNHLLRTMPLLVRLYCTTVAYQGGLAEMLQALLVALNTDDIDPTSLLAFVSPAAAKGFVETLSNPRAPLMSTEHETKIWQFISTVVSNRQQWLTISLLTGSTPKDRLDKQLQAATAPSDTLLSSTLEKLSNLDAIPPACAKQMLAFVANAQNYWPWATTAIGSHATFLSAMTEWLANLESRSNVNDPETATRCAHENHMAASIADILATYIHNAPRTEAKSIVAKYLPKLRFLCAHGVDVKGYNHSLHKTLAKNFAHHFPDHALDDFKRTAIRAKDYGREYYYDLDRAGQMLGSHQAWIRQNGQGFEDEVARASVNFSLVDSELFLLSKWKALAVEISQYAGEDAVLQRDLAQIVSSCLKANMEPSLPASICDDLTLHRADLAFALLQRLVGISSRQIEVQRLVFVAWDAVRTFGNDFDVLTQADDIAFYRHLLRILYLTLQLQTRNDARDEKHDHGKHAASRTSKAAGVREETLHPLLIEVVQKVIAVNFRALCSSVHADASAVDHADFVLLTAMLQSVLAIKGATAIYQQIAAVVSDTALIRYAASLYSWSHSLRLTTAIDDPIFGLLSVLFLLSLSTIPACAEEMATSCIITQLSTATTSVQLFRNSPSGRGPFDHPLRAHDIWNRGILPLCLNLLQSVGPAIAAEISTFLNSFPNQLSRVVRDVSARIPLRSTNDEDFEPGRQVATEAGYSAGITLGLASETHSLALLSLIIERLRQAGPESGLDAGELQALEIDRSALKDEVDALLGPKLAGSANLFDRIVPLGAKEVEWARLPAVGHAAAKEKDAKHADETRHSGIGAGRSTSLLQVRILSELRGAAECLGAI